LFVIILVSLFVIVLVSLFVVVLVSLFVRISREDRRSRAHAFDHDKFNLCAIIELCARIRGGQSGVTRTLLIRFVFYNSRRNTKQM
jgi:hypothetical protein